MAILEELLVLPPNAHKEKYETIRKYLKENTTMLEWGSGYSTIALSKEVKHIYTVEHSLYWFNLIKILASILQIENITILGAGPQNKDKDEKIKFATYIRAPEILKQQYDCQKFNIVLIDGIARNHCLESIIPFLYDDSVVMVDDCDRDYETYRDIISESYEIIEKNKSGSALLVLKKRN